MLKLITLRSATVAVCSISVVCLAVILLGLTESRDIVNSIPSPPGFDNGAEYLLGWLWAFVLCIVIALLPISNRERMALLALWFAKIAVTLGFMLIYEAAYGLDAWLYYFQATTGQEFIPGSEIGGNVAMVDSINFLLLFQPISYHATKVSFAFIGLAGIYVFYRACVTYLERDDLRILFFLGLFPSILFWSSILGKDPMTFFGVSLYTLGVVNLFKNGRVRSFGLVLLGIVIATWIRAWYMPLMTVPLILVLLANKKHLAVGSFLILLVSMLGIYFQAEIAAFLLNRGIVISVDLVQALEAHGTAFAEDGSATIGTPPDLSTPSSFFAHLPYGTFAMLFRPLPGEVMNPFGLLVGMENAFILLLLYKAFRNFRWEYLDKTQCWALVYVLIWAAFHGLVVLNFGTSVRFRLNMLPLLIAPLAYLAYWRPNNDIQRQ